MDKRTFIGIIIAVVLGIFPATAIFSFCRTTPVPEREYQGFRVQFPVMGTIAGFSLYTSDHQKFLAGCAAGKAAFEKVSKVTGVPVEYLTCFEENENAPIEGYQSEFNEIFRKLDEERREELINYGTYLSNK